jgi:hypothetical protein
VEAGQPVKLSRTNGRGLDLFQQLTHWQLRRQCRCKAVLAKRSVIPIASFVVRCTTAAENEGRFTALGAFAPSA